jgi:hypothetical protein
MLCLQLVKGKAFRVPSFDALFTELLLMQEQVQGKVRDLALGSKVV